MIKGYIAWVLPEKLRAELLAAFPVTYERTIAHHITYKFGVPESEGLPVVDSMAIVGMANDEKGVQCLIVEVNGSSKRDDGSVYHITWSLSANRKPVDSNKVAKNWPDMDLDQSLQAVLYNPIEIKLTPTFIPLY